MSRHAATEKQLAEIAAKEFTLVCAKEGRELGEFSINSEDDQVWFSETVIDLIEKNEIRGIFGVFSTPVLELMAHRAEDGALDEAAHCWAAWNVNRAKEGEKPTFDHLRFCWVGYL